MYVTKPHLSSSVHLVIVGYDHQYGQEIPSVSHNYTSPGEWIVHHGCPQMYNYREVIHHIVIILCRYIVETRHIQMDTYTLTHTHAHTCVHTHTHTHTHAHTCICYEDTSLCNTGLSAPVSPKYTSITILQLCTNNLTDKIPSLVTLDTWSCLDNVLEHNHSYLHVH